MLGNPPKMGANLFPTEVIPYTQLWQRPENMLKSRFSPYQVEVITNNEVRPADWSRPHFIIVLVYESMSVFGDNLAGVDVLWNDFNEIERADSVRIFKNLTQADVIVTISTEELVAENLTAAVSIVTQVTV